MNVNFPSKTISKSKGKRTPSGTINFVQLHQFIQIWRIEVGPMVAFARSQINQWRGAGRPASQISALLHGVIVTFGEGKRFVWPQVQKFMAGHPLRGNTATANGAIATVDNNVANTTPTNISNLFKQLALIKGLGSCSYASKVLRCLCDKHVVLDGLIKQELGERVYVDFRQRCEDIANAMSPTCSPADVEGGLFVWLQILNPKQKKARWKRWQLSASIKCNVQIEDFSSQKANETKVVGRPCIWLEEGPKNYLKIVDHCGAGNDGMICLGHKKPHIWLKNNGASARHLIGEIVNLGGGFTAKPGYLLAPGGVPNCGVGGANYQGGVRFGSPGEAVKYLLQYFNVYACPKNKQFNQEWIESAKLT